MSGGESLAPGLVKGARRAPRRDVDSAAPRSFLGWIALARLLPKGSLLFEKELHQGRVAQIV